MKAFIFGEIEFLNSGKFNRLGIATEKRPPTPAYCFYKFGGLENGLEVILWISEVYL